MIVQFDFLLWMLVGVIGVWSLPLRWQTHVMTAWGIAFMGYYAPYSAGLLAILGVASYSFAKLRKTAWFWLWVALLCAVFAVYKCYGVREFSSSPVHAWLGVVFYILRILHYNIEAYLRRLPAHNGCDYAAYLFFMPILWVGPLERFENFQQQLKQRHFNRDMFSRGLERILYGYVKVVVLANVLVMSYFNELLQGLDASSRLYAYGSCLQYGLNLYLQFSGYCDVAIGLAALLGIRLQENFSAPWRKTNVGQFWQSWHRTLSQWCRDYVFMPIAASTRKPALATLAAMLVFALWHEFSLRYVIWGLYQGLGIVIWQRWRRSCEVRAWTFTARPWWRICAWLLTMHFILFSFAWTKEPNVRAALQTYKHLLGVE